MNPALGRIKQELVYFMGVLIARENMGLSRTTCQLNLISFCIKVKKLNCSNRNANSIWYPAVRVLKLLPQVQNLDLGVGSEYMV